jgi:hypothetical protein
LLLVLARAVILGSESRGTQHHILLSQIRDNPTWSARPLYLYPPGTGWPSYTPRYWVPCSSPPTTLRAMLKVLDPASTRVRLNSKLCPTYNREENTVPLLLYPLLRAQLSARPHRKHRFPVSPLGRWQLPSNGCCPVCFAVVAQQREYTQQYVFLEGISCFKVLKQNEISVPRVETSRGSGVSSHTGQHISLRHRVQYGSGGHSTWTLGLKGTERDF